MKIVVPVFYQVERVTPWEPNSWKVTLVAGDAKMELIVENASPFVQCAAREWCVSLESTVELRG